MMFPDMTSQSAALFSRAQNALPGGNTRHSIAYAPYPLYAKHGEGCRITDVDGATYIDCVNNMSANIHGHRHPAIVEAATRQMEKFISIGSPTEVEIELAELLTARLPSVERIRFCNSGTEALMFAARAARAFTGRRKIAKIEGGYHGSYDALDVSNKPLPDRWGDADFPDMVREGAGLTPGATDDTIIFQANRTASTRALLERHGDELAAVFIDPVVSRMGFLPLSKEFLTMIREETAKRGVLLIFDEVFSFRLGRQGAQGVVGVRPDLSTFGKIIGGGFPIGAFGGRRDVMDVFNHLHEGGARVEHSGTFFGNPVSMAAGIASLELLDEDAFAHLDALGEQLRGGLETILKDRQMPGQAMGQGSLIALTPHLAPYSDYRDFFQGFAARAEEFGSLFANILNNRVLPVFPTGFILSTPMTRAEIDDILSSVDDGIKAMRTAA